MGFFSELVDFVRNYGEKQRALPALPEQRRDQGSVVNPLTGLGGMRDKGNATQVNLNKRPLDDQELEITYELNGIARRIVDLLPYRAIRRGWVVPDIGETDKELAVTDKIMMGASLGRLYGGCAVYMVTEDDIPGEFRNQPKKWLEQPLDLERVGKLHALQYFDVWSAFPQQYEYDIRSTGYRHPRLWSISDEGFQAQVHHSRILWFRGRPRPPYRQRMGNRRDMNRMPDDSILQAVWDEIARLLSTHQGGAILATEMMQNVLKIGDLPATLAGDQGAQFRERIALMSRSLSLMNMAVIGPNDDLHKQSTPGTGYGELATEMRTMVAAVSDYPEVVLFGTTPGGLNTDGESGWEGMRQTVSDWQQSKLKRNLERFYQVVYRAQDGPSGGQEPKEWDVKFNALDEPTQLDKASVMLTVAQMDQIYEEMGVYDIIDIAKQRFGTDGFQLEIEVEPPDAADVELREAQSMGLMGPAMGGEPNDEVAPEDRDATAGGEE